MFPLTAQKKGEGFVSFVSIKIYYYQIKFKFSYIMSAHCSWIIEFIRLQHNTLLHMFIYSPNGYRMFIEIVVKITNKNQIFVFLCQS